MSNLRWTQKIYDLMNENNQIQAPDPLNEDNVLAAATNAINQLMSEEYIPHIDLIGDALQPLLTEVKTITSNEAQLIAMLNQANAESVAYAGKHILKSTSSKKSKKEGKKTATASVEQNQ